MHNSKILPTCKLPRIGSTWENQSKSDVKGHWIVLAVANNNMSDKPILIVAKKLVEHEDIRTFRIPEWNNLFVHYNSNI